MRVLSIAEMERLVNACAYKHGWFIHFSRGIAGNPVDKPRPYIQIENLDGVDALTDLPAPWKGGKHYISLYACRQEVVSTVYTAIMAAEMHEMRENFHFRGRSIYNPHIDPDVLAEVCADKSSFNLRDNSMSMEETP